MQAVPAAGGPPVDQADHHLGHKPDQPLHLQDVQPSRPRKIDGLGRLTSCVLIAGAPANALISTGTERPTTVLGRRPVSRQQHHPDVGRHPGVVQNPVQLVHRVRAKRISYLGTVERDPVPSRR
jgi:hypothetical protein